METFDIFALSGLEWVYDRVERRHGRAVAFLVTLTLAVVIVASLVAVLIAIL